MTRIALITGGNRGLGRATALALAEDGTDAIVTYRSHADEAAAVVGDLRARSRAAVALRLDTIDHDSFPSFADESGCPLRRTSSSPLSLSIAILIAVGSSACSASRPGLVKISVLIDPGIGQAR